MKSMLNHAYLGTNRGAYWCNRIYFNNSKEDNKGEKET